MTNFELEQKFAQKVKEERRITNEVIELLDLINRRGVFAERGYDSLFGYLTKKYKYSEGAANRRIAAMHLMRSVPETKTKLITGDLNLSTVVKAQTIIRAQEKATKSKISAEAKAAALKQIENKSTAVAEQTLLSLFPAAASALPQERITVLTEDTSRLNGNVSNDVLERFKQVKVLLSNKLPNASFIEVADYLFKKLLSEENGRATAAAKQSVNNDNKTVTPKTKRIVISRAENKCQYKDPITGKICGSTYKLQVDHLHPKALGGNNASDNLRCLCPTHNRLMAEKILGKVAANRWRLGRANARA